ncbi:MAG: hypothetical protein ACFFAI_07480 [Promethearchaeota archaeon]
MRTITIKNYAICQLGVKLCIWFLSVKLFETNEQRNRKRGGKGIYSKPIENTDVNKLNKQDINEFLKCEWFNKLTNHTKDQHLNYFFYFNITSFPISI